jgi:hypothetical protein
MLFGPQADGRPIRLRLEREGLMRLFRLWSGVENLDRR